MCSVDGERFVVKVLESGMLFLIVIPWSWNDDSMALESLFHDHGIINTPMDIQFALAGGCDVAAVRRMSQPYR